MPEYLKLISRVSFVDAGILTVILLIGFLIWKDLFWFKKLFNMKISREFIYFIIASVGVAVWIEIKGVYILKEWSYLASMPLILGLGFSPLVQLSVTGFMGLWFFKQK